MFFKNINKNFIYNKFKTFYSKIEINKNPPTSFCCFTDENDSNIGIKGFHYNAETGPIAVLDSKTILLKQFKLDGTKAPGKK